MADPAVDSTVLLAEARAAPTGAGDLDHFGENQAEDAGATAAPVATSSLVVVDEQTVPDNIPPPPTVVEAGEAQPAEAPPSVEAALSSSVVAAPPPSVASIGPPKDKDTINVAIRCRPPGGQQDKNRQDIVKILDETLVCLQDPGSVYRLPSEDYLRVGKTRDKRYCFDFAFGPECSTEELYTRTAQPLVDAVLEGYNATVFAYGATGAGKTHTMVGPSAERPGIMSLCFQDLFEKINAAVAGGVVVSGTGGASRIGAGGGSTSIGDRGQRTTTTNSDVKVRCCFVEVYNEYLRDLLNSVGTATNGDNVDRGDAANRRRPGGTAENDPDSAHHTSGAGPDNHLEIML